MDVDKQALENLRAVREAHYLAYRRVKMNELEAEICRKRQVDAIKDGDEPEAARAGAARRQYLARAETAQKSLRAQAAKVRNEEDLYGQIVSRKPLQGHRY